MHDETNNYSIFDYGCGEGSLVSLLVTQSKVKIDQIFGYDLSTQAIDICKLKCAPNNYSTDLTDFSDQQFDIIICSEVIEHTVDYREVLGWIFKHLNHDGKLLLTTQAGRIHPSDQYVGHTQHFKLSQLKSTLESIGFKIIIGRYWGFPFFTLQKYLTNFKFEKIKEQFLVKKPGALQKLVFNIANLIFFCHELIPYGPQIFLLASKSYDKQIKNRTTVSY